MTADAQEIAAHDAEMPVYVGEMTGYASEIMKGTNKKAVAPMCYGSKPTWKPCFFASLDRSIQDLLAQA